MAQRGPAIRIRSLEFRREREGSWAELDDLVGRVEKSGLKSLSAPEVLRLPVLYRGALSSLSVARTISLDQNLTEYLEALVGRAYFCVYGTRKKMAGAVLEFFTRRFPAAVRGAGWHILVATLFLVLGVVTAFTIVSANPDRFHTFVGADYAQGRGPAASTADLESMLYDDSHESGALARFAASLFTHNAKIGIVAFALGFIFGMPVVLLMFMNGLILGAFASLYHSRGLSIDLWGWLLPHGITELGAVVLCGGAGLLLAQGVIAPGSMSRRRSLAARGRHAALVVIGAVLMFFVAGLIEGVFRQTVTDVTVRYAVAIATAVLWLAYFGLAGRSQPE